MPVALSLAYEDLIIWPWKIRDEVEMESSHPSKAKVPEDI